MSDEQPLDYAETADRIRGTIGNGAMVSMDATTPELMEAVHRLTVEMFKVNSLLIASGVKFPTRLMYLQAVAAYSALTSAGIDLADLDLDEDEE